ncbi:DNA-binding transcriptional ArsR family regulator [Streptomyces sp. SLBN-118]|uniref:DUF5937 family protein n=1 Tax=Streptomyces sp. SLBN-118 TaxID=2768454 RepID=UPI00115308C6|nr:DUF5937 family protein [Streptomyces sp. SLBN-118]TQK42352.1 DNA-binding transcriptional ArsR family regulator [Streptomyces sp. SLBN-118]
MSVTIDIAGLPPERIRFAPSPLGELTAMLHVLSEPGHHPALSGWAVATAALLESELADRLLEAETLWRSARADFLIPGRPGLTLADELDAIDRIEDEAYVAAALTSQRASAPIHPMPSPLTDPAARHLALDIARARGPQQAAFAELLLADPPAVRAWVRRLLHDCEEAFFADTWQRIRNFLTADARQKTDLLIRQGPAKAMAAVSSAVTLDETRHRIVIDKLQDVSTSADGDGVTFIPSIHGRPHLTIVFSPGWRPVVQYPATETGLPHPVPPEVVQRRLEALAHPVRIRLCRTLSRGGHTTGELAAFWQLSAPAVSRHLAVLKKAGLLTTRRRGRYVLYELDLDTSARLGIDLLEAVLR